MSNVSLRNKIAWFSQCELDCNSGRLNIHGEKQKLEPMVHQFLLLLIQHQGDLVSKKQVFDTLWPNKEASDVALRALVKKAREALKDNARSPDYIKTVPKKGYLLIPSVNLVSTDPEPSKAPETLRVIEQKPLMAKELASEVLTNTASWRHKHVNSLAIAGILATVFVLSGIWYFFTSSLSFQTSQQINIVTQNLATLERPNVSTYSIAGGIKNIWLEGSALLDNNIIVIEDLNTSFRQQVVFPMPVKSSFWLSGSTQYLLIERVDQQGFFVLHFDQQKSKPAVTQYNATLPKQSKILALYFSGTQIIVQHGDLNSIGLFDLQSAKLIDDAELPAIIKNLANQVRPVRLITNGANDESATGDIQSDAASIIQDTTLQVWTSFASQGAFKGVIAALTVGEGTEATARKTRLLYYNDESTGNPAFDVPLPNGVSNAVFNPQGDRFSFINDIGKLSAFQTQDGHITSFNTHGEVINQLVADCGVGCFVIINSHGIPKLSEIATQFDPQTDVGANQNSSQIQTIFTNAITRNEYLPQYTQQGLYFVSQQDGATSIVFRDNDKVESILYTFSMPVSFDEMTIDSHNMQYDTQIAGIVNKRMFLFDLQRREMDYLPNSFTSLSHIDFANASVTGANRGNASDFLENNSNDNSFNTNVIHFYGQINRNQESTDARRPNGLYEYRVDTQQVNLLEAGVKVKRTIELIDTTEKGDIRYMAVFNMLDNGTATVAFNSTKPLLTVNLSSTCMHCWHIKGNYLYQIQVNAVQQQPAKMLKTSLLTGEVSEYDLWFDNLEYAFSLHPVANTMVVSTRQRLQTQITKIEGISQIY